MTYQKPFAPSEYERRVRDVKQRMEQSGFDLLICQDPASMYWLTGYDGYSFYVPQAVLVHLKSDMPVWFGRLVDVNSAHVTTYLPPENIVWFSDHRLQHAELHPFDDLCNLIESHGWAADRIGVELDAHYYTARAHQHLVRGLPNAKIADSRELVNLARLVKSDAELVYMREAGQMVSKTMREAVELIKPGLPQHELVAQICASQVRGLDGKYGDFSAPPHVQSGEQTNTPHLSWTDEPLPASGLVLVEFGGMRRRYCAPLCRTVHIGKPPEEITRLADVIVEGVDAVLEMAKPGILVEEVNAVWQNILNRNGYSKIGRSGYSVGVFYPPTWVERSVSFRSGDKTVLQAGMCFHFQTGVRLQEFGAAISETFAVTDRGGERLTDVERRLIVVD